MGVGGDREMINGITFASHIAPASMTMLAFAALPRPWWSGALLALATWTLFYPAFFFPAWAGYYWRSKPRLVAFLGGFALAGLAIGVPVLLRSQPIEGRGIVSTVMHETQGHQQDPHAYGSSPFGFWGQRGGIRAILREPLVAGQPNTAPAFLLFAAFVVGSFFLARGNTELQLALLTGALGYRIAALEDSCHRRLRRLVLRLPADWIPGPSGPCPQGRDRELRPTSFMRRATAGTRANMNRPI